MWIVVAILGACAFMTTIVQWFTALGCKQEVEQLAPEYAARLYRPFRDQIITRDDLSLRTLFLAPVPSEAKATVTLLRWVLGFWVMTSIGFLAAMLVTMAATM
jgi:hypothetical protein